MQKELYEAAIEGSVQKLHELLKQDPLILDRNMVSTFIETPLHIGAMLGHTDFCQELLKLKPELAEKLDSRRSSALHLASAKGYLQIAKYLLSVSKRICSITDVDGLKAVHIAAMKGEVDVLKELMDEQPEEASAIVGIPPGDSVFHLCVKYSQFDALKALWEHLKDESLLNTMDDNGNSILHLAESLPVICQSLCLNYHSRHQGRLSRYKESE